MPNGNGSGKQDALHETASRGVEALNVLVQQRDELLVTCDKQGTALALYQERTRQLEGRLAQSTAERDHYMRYCTELTTKLNDIQMLILNCVEAAKHAAYKPTQHAPMGSITDKMTEEDNKNLKNLLNRLRPADGVEDGTNASQ